MKTRVLAIAVAVAASLAGPASALADAPAALTAEPIVIAPGYAGICPNSFDSSAGYSSSFNGLVNAPPSSWTVTKADGTKAVVKAVPSNRVYVWTYPDPSLPANEQYDQCNAGSIRNLAKRFYNRLTRLRTTWGYTGKVDVVGISLGSVVTRYCIRNFYGETPNCAAMIDDWVGLVPPSHGSDLLSPTFCQNSSLILAPSGPCKDLIRTPQSQFLTELNSPAYPGAPEGAAPGVEYTTAYTWNDDAIVPGSSGAITGAANWRIRAYPGSVQSADPTHGTPASSTSCPGSSLNKASATVEWAAYELLDVQAHGVGTGEFYCNSGPIPAPAH